MKKREGDESDEPQQPESERRSDDRGDLRPPSEGRDPADRGDLRRPDAPERREDRPEAKPSDFLWRERDRPELKAWGDGPDPGRFEFTPDEAGRPLVAEGWLRPIGKGDAGRSDEARRLQGASREGIATHDRSDGTPGLEWDGGHLIAHKHGGPEVAGNVVPMEARMNKSYVAGVEKMIDQEIAAGQPIYLRTEVAYRPDDRVPYTVRHEVFTVDEHDGPQKLHDTTTMVDRRAHETRAAALKNEQDNGGLLH